MVLDTLCCAPAQLCFLFRVSSLFLLRFRLSLFSVNGADFCPSIDGVLLHKSTPIAGAADTLKYLQKNDIPFIFLTNGGGKSEAERAAQLSSLLGIDVRPDVLVQSHTPFKALLNLPTKHLKASNVWTASNSRIDETSDTGLRRKTILVLGSDASKARRIATEYGFESVVTPGDILKACPDIFPFDPLTEFYNKQEILPLPKPLYSSKDGTKSLEECLRIHAVLVFNDPRDWAVDIQLVRDLISSYKGYLGTTASDYPPEEQSQPPVQVIFSNGDYEWSSGYHLSRLGQGAFRNALHGGISEGLGQKSTVDSQTFIQFGKPMVLTYAYAENALNLQLQKPSGAAAPPLERVYMVGDNPASDIAGANETTHEKFIRYQRMVKMGQSEETAAAAVAPEWRGCLVKTGVYRDGNASLLQHGRQPEVILDDVKSVVKWALQQEGRSSKELV